jgi:hypothetical protein
VEPADTSAAKLAEYAGQYTSPELAGVWELVVRENALVLHRNRGDDERLNAAYRDAFAGPGLIQFERDGRGRVTSLLLNSRGVHALRMTRR